MVVDESKIKTICCTAKDLVGLERDTNWEKAEDLFEVQDYVDVLQSSMLSVCAIDTEKDKILGFLALEVRNKSIASEMA